MYRFNKIISPTLLLLVVAENNRRAWFYWKGRNCMVFGKENLFLPRIGSKPSGTIFTFEPDTQPLHVTFYNKQGRRINSKFRWAHFINKFTIKKLVGQVIIQDHLKSVGFTSILDEIWGGDHPADPRVRRTCLKLKWTIPTPSSAIIIMRYFLAYFTIWNYLSLINQKNDIKIRKQTITTKCKKTSKHLCL